MSLRQAQLAEAIKELAGVIGDLSRRLGRDGDPAAAAKLSAIISGLEEVENGTQHQPRQRPAPEPRIRRAKPKPSGNRADRNRPKRGAKARVHRRTNRGPGVEEQAPLG